ncbi:Alpha/beta hydrolase family protein (plasmid) [Marinibacterium anthonyi]|nr:Alpha/beta hydrolase family protein [Marinibacterium anthonyi]
MTKATHDYKLDRCASEEPYLIHECDDLAIWVNSMPGDYAFISFSGVGRAGRKENKPEFVKSFEHLRAPGLFVADKKRRWWNHGLIDVIANRVNGYIHNRYRKVVLIGNSMGGTGALLLSPHIENVAAVIAFAPQATVKPDIIEEKRWKKEIKGISDWTAPALTTAQPSSGREIKIKIFFGAECDKDVVHMEHLKKAFPTADMHVIQGADHSVARHLRMTGALETYLSSALNLVKLEEGKTMSEEVEIDKDLILDLARALFAAQGDSESKEWQDEKDELRKIARRTIRRMQAAGYNIEKAS